MCARDKLSRDVDAIASSVVQHLAGLLDAKVTITIEIEAEIPTGAPDNLVRTVTASAPSAVAAANSPENEPPGTLRHTLSRKQIAQCVGPRKPQMPLELRSTRCASIVPAGSFSR
jgi:hypothetical protein